MGDSRGKTQAAATAPFPWVHVGNACAVLVLGVAAAYSLLWTSAAGEWQWIHVFDDALNFYNPQYPYPVDNVQGMSHFDGWTWDNVRWMWTTRHTAVYEPLSWMLKAAVFSVAGMDSLAYRRASLLLHTLNTLLCFALLMRVLPRAFGVRADWRVVASAAAGALFFGVHPLRAECVAWPSGQAYTPCGLFVLLSVHAYISYVDAPPGPRRTAWYVLALLAFGASLLSKSASLLAWTALPALDWYPLRRFDLDGAVRRVLRGRMDAPTRRCVAEKLPFLALSIVVVYLAVDATSVEVRRAAFAPDSTAHRHELSPAGALAQFFSSLVFSGALTVYPTQLSPAYGIEPRDLAWGHGPVLWSAVAVLLLAWLAVALRHRVPALLPALVVYVCVMTPTSGAVVQHGALIAGADRYTYLSGLVPAALVGACVLWVGSASRERMVRVLVVCALVALVLGVQTSGEVARWRTGRTRFESAHRADPSTSGHLLRLGRHFLQVERDNDAAEATFRRCTYLNARNDQCWLQLGVLLFRSERRDEACRVYREALARRPGNPYIRNNIALCKWVGNDRDGALAMWNRIHKEFPTYRGTIRNLNAVQGKERLYLENL